MSAFSKLKINTEIKTSAKAYGRSYNREKVVRRLESYMTYWVRWEKEQKTMEVNAGKTLLEVMIEAGMHPDAPCGGEGKCGKCRVWCHGQGEEEREVLACQTRVDRDLWVRTGESVGAIHVLTGGYGRKTEIHPLVTVQRIALAPRKEQPGLSEWERLQKASGIPLRESLPMVRKLSQRNTKDGADLWIVRSREKVLELSFEQEEPQVWGAAFDIGTTSLAGYLVDLKSGEVLTTASAINPQFSYGADVIGRANYALEESEEPLTACIREKVNEMLAEMCRRAQGSCQDVYAVSMVGNSCMHHLFLGISPQSMVHAPYQPAVNRHLILPASDLGIEAASEAEVFWLPLIAGFVGADTVGGLLSTELAWQDELSLLIDIGTNGELVMGNRSRRMACSTAAGPALEGAKISCGMRGADGAIEHVEVDESGGVHIQVIGGEIAKGICGSGLIDAIAVLLRIGVIDDDGHMNSDDQINGQPVYWFRRPQGTDSGVYLSQKDVREVQLAKGAIAAGVTLLAEQLGITLTKIEKVYLAGAFGTYLRPENACRIGLIPRELENRITAVGNSAGEGAIQILTCENAIRDAERLARETEFLELASLPEFQDVFVDELSFE